MMSQNTDSTSQKDNFEAVIERQNLVLISISYYFSMFMMKVYKVTYNFHLSKSQTILGGDTALSKQFQTTV